MNSKIAEAGKVQKSLGQLAYERDLAAVPVYQDGGKRPGWDRLGEIAKDSWERNPTDRVSSADEEFADLKSGGKVHVVREDGWDTSNPQRFRKVVYFKRDKDAPDDKVEQTVVCVSFCDDGTVLNTSEMAVTQGENLSRPVLIDHGPVVVPPEVFSAAYAIRLENYKVNTPKQFQVRPLHERDAGLMIHHLASLAGVPAERIDYVYFSCAKGAEEHVDALDPARFTERTLMVPVVVPRGRAILSADGLTIQIQANHVYEFNHERPHALNLEDTVSGCAVVMAWCATSAPH